MQQLEIKKLKTEFINIPLIISDFNTLYLNKNCFRISLLFVYIHYISLSILFLSSF